MNGTHAGGILRQAKEAVFGVTERHPSPTNANTNTRIPSDPDQFSVEHREGLSGPATWAAQKLGMGGDAHEHPKNTTEPNSPARMMSGIDQFGGENAEREDFGVKDGDRRVDMGRLTKWPEGLDQFGGEDDERTRPLTPSKR
jgi:hypothetical protein